MRSQGGVVDISGCYVLQEGNNHVSDAVLIEVEYGVMVMNAQEARNDTILSAREHNELVINVTSWHIKITVGAQVEIDEDCMDCSQEMKRGACVVYVCKTDMETIEFLHIV